MGLVMALVTVVNAEFLRPWPIPDADRIVVLRARPAPGEQYGYISGPAYRYLREHSNTLRHLSAWLRGGAEVELDGTRTNVQTNFVTSNYFDMLGVGAPQGRGFRPADEDYVQPRPVAVISHRLWQDVFRAPSNIVGRTVRVHNALFTVVGVMPAGFTDVHSQEGLRIDLWMPLPSIALLFPDWSTHFDDPSENVGSGVAGRLAEGATRAQATAELTVLSQRLRSSLAQQGAGIDVHGTRRVERDPDSVLRLAAPMAMAFVGLGLVLLLACANVGNLLLARGLGRRRELAVRIAVGASRGRVTRQLVTESILLAGIASVVGTGIGWFAMRTFVATQSPLNDTSLLTPDLTVAGMASALAIVVVLVAGLLPSLRLTRSNIGTTASTRHGRGAGWLRTSMLAAQLAISMTLLVAAGLLTRAMGYGLTLDPGFAIHEVQVLSFELGGVSDDRREGFDRALRDGIERLGLPPHGFSDFPAITTSVAYANVRTRGNAATVTRQVSVRGVSPGYFLAAGIPLVAGRVPSGEVDTEVVVNQTVARMLWPQIDPVGRLLTFGQGDAERIFTVVGIATDVPTMSAQRIDPVLYTPTTASRLLFVRSLDPSIVDVVGGVARSIEPSVRVVSRPLADDLRNVLRELRWAGRFAWALGSLALVLATVGAFGVFAYMVEERRREIGVRMALGATSANVVRAVVGGVRRPLGLGLGSGLLLSILCAQLLRGTLYGLSPFDPITYIGIAAVLTIAALLATWIPARRATRIDPAVTLRGD
jgi:predicted permease